MNKTHTKTQKQTNNGFRNTQKHSKIGLISVKFRKQAPPCISPSKYKPPKLAR